MGQSRHFGEGRFGSPGRERAEEAMGSSGEGGRVRRPRVGAGRKVERRGAGRKQLNTASAARCVQGRQEIPVGWSGAHVRDTRATLCTTYKCRGPSFFLRMTSES